MPRTYKNKNIHTKPSMSGVKNLSIEFDSKNRDVEEDSVMETLSEMFTVGVEKAKRKSAWTGEDLEREIKGYFEYCFIKKLKPCKAGIRTYLGISRTQYYDWQTNPSRYGVLSNIINIANDIMEQEYIDKSQKYPTSNLFLLRTSHGHVETSKVDVVTNGATASTVDEVNDLVSKLGLGEKK